MDYITKNKVQISYMDFRGLCVRWAYIEGATEKDVERQTGINRRTFQRYRNKFNIHRK